MTAHLMPPTMLTGLARSAIGSALLALVIASMGAGAFVNGQSSGF